MYKIPIRVDKNSEYDIFCGRPSIYSNPFKINIDGTRKEILKKYENYLNNIENFGEYVRELGNKRLACWCTLNEVCHVDLLINKISEYKKNLLIESISE